MNRLNKHTLLRKAAEKELNTYNEESKVEIARKYKKRTTIIDLIFGIILALIFVSSVVVFIVQAIATPAPLIAWVVFVIYWSVSGGFAIWMFMDYYNISRLSLNELAIKAIIDKYKRSNKVPEILERAQIELLDANFVVSKSIKILAYGFCTNLLVDYKSQKFTISEGSKIEKIYNFKDVINYEVYENGKSQVQGRAGSALVGGAFFGLGGLVVGSSLGRSVNSMCDQLELIIRVNDSISPQIKITYFKNANLEKNGDLYRGARDNLHLICSELEFMMNAKKLEESAYQKAEFNSVTKSSKEQLQELKEMLDSGLITQEDYEKKKKQILGL